MAITVVPEPDAIPPRMRVTVTRGGETRDATVVRVAANGATTPVRAAVRLSGGTGLVWDYEAPYGVPVAYRIIDGTATETSTLSVLDAGLPWLVHPYTPSLSVPVTGAAHGAPLTAFTAEAWRSTSRPSSASAVDVLNRDTPVVQRVGRRRARTSQMVLRTRTREQWAAMDALVADDSPLLLQVPAAAEARWGVTTCWVQLADVDDERESHGRDAARLWTLPYRVVGRPEGTARGSWVYAQESSEFATYADLGATYRSYNDLEADIRQVPA